MEQDIVQPNTDYRVYGGGNAQYMQQGTEEQMYRTIYKRDSPKLKLYADGRRVSSAATLIKPCRYSGCARCMIHDCYPRWNPTMCPGPRRNANAIHPQNTRRRAETWGILNVHQSKVPTNFFYSSRRSILMPSANLGEALRGLLTQRVPTPWPSLEAPGGDAVWCGDTCVVCTARTDVGP